MPVIILIAAMVAASTLATVAKALSVLIAAVSVWAGI